MEKRNILKNQKGFTLIEIIAVLVILGILAAVAVPRFINLSADAREKAIDGALAAGASNSSLLFAQNILSNDGAVPTMASLAASLNTASYQTVGDYTVSYTTSVSGITVTVNGPANLISGVPAAATSKEFRLVN